jgi:nucleoside 2-deoxyribosyltransferase
MKGFPEENLELFNTVHAKIALMGDFEILNPHNLKTLLPDEKQNYPNYLGFDLFNLASCDAICLIDQEHATSSKGTAIELAFAIACGIPVLDENLKEINLKVYAYGNTNKKAYPDHFKSEIVFNQNKSILSESKSNEVAGKELEGIV